MTTPSTIAIPDEPDRPAISSDAAGESVLVNYPGSKGGAGVLQTIINNIPPCDTFIEAFAGTALLTHSLRPARSRIVIDADEVVCGALHRSFVKPGTKLIEQTAFDFGAAETCANATGLRIVRGDAVAWLEKHRAQFDWRTVIYFDPPYLVNRHGEQRRDYYTHEFKSVAQHRELLQLLERLSAADVWCLISGYRCPLYDDLLSTWRRVDYRTTTRRGPVIESLWCNFPEPEALHDYRYLGRNFRERERIKRKQKRWRGKLAKMSPLERAVIVEAVRDLTAGNDDGCRHASPEVASGYRITGNGGAGR